MSIIHPRYLEIQKIIRESPLSLAEKLKSKEIGALLEEALQYVTPEQRRATHEKSVANGDAPEEATHCDEDGIPVPTASEMAQKLGVPLDKLMARIKELEDGLGISLSDDDATVHRIQ